MRVLNSKYNIERADFTDCMFFQPALIHKSSTQRPKALNQHGIAEKTKKYLSMNVLSRLYSRLILEISTLSSWLSLSAITECLHAFLRAIKEVRKFRKLCY